MSHGSESAYVTVGMTERWLRF